MHPIVYSGIDVSEEFFHASIHNCERDKPEVKQFANTAPGFVLFAEWVESHHPNVQYRVVMEHTGGCEKALATFLFFRGWKVSLVDGLKISRYRESYGKGAKTDANDARLLARYAAERRPPFWAPQPQEYEELRELVRHRLDLEKELRAWENRNRKVSASTLVNQQRKAQVAVLKASMESAELAMFEHIKAHQNLLEDWQLIDSVYGFGERAAAIVLGEIGSIEFFHSARELALFAGLCPIMSQSGKSEGRAVLHPYGNKELRCSLFMPGMASMRKESPFYEFAERVRKGRKGVGKLVVVAVMRKQLQAIYGVLKSRKPFDAARLKKDMEPKQPE